MLKVGGENVKRRNFTKTVAYSLCIFILYIFDRPLGIVSGIVTVFNFNAIDFFQKHFPYSIIITILFISLIFCISIITKMKNKGSVNSSKNDVEKYPDLKIIDEMLTFFNGEKLNYFFYNIELNMLLCSQAEDFNNQCRIFRSPHKKLRNKKLEKVKQTFLIDIQRILDYPFHSADGAIARLDYKHTDRDYEKDILAVKNSWAKFLKSVQKKYPNYELK